MNRLLQFVGCEEFITKGIVKTFIQKPDVQTFMLTVVPRPDAPVVPGWTPCDQDGFRQVTLTLTAV